MHHARDSWLKRHVAIKILPAAWTQNHSAVERFIRETHLASALNHPNIITIYDIGQHENILFIATELTQGQALRQQMKIAHLKLSEALNQTARGWHTDPLRYIGM